MQRRVHVEEGRRVVDEVVVAGHVLVGGTEGVVGGGDGEVEGDGGQFFHQLRDVGCHAADVEEGGDGADGLGHRSGVLEVAGVVLGAPSDGDVGEGEAFGWGGEGDWCWRIVRSNPEEVISIVGS